MLSDKKKVYNIILEKKIKAKIDEIAKEQDRSSSSLINHVLKNYTITQSRKAKPFNKTIE